MAKGGNNGGVDDGDDMTEVIYSVNNNDNDQLHEVPMTASVQDIIAKGLTLWREHGLSLIHI